MDVGAIGWREQEEQIAREADSLLHAIFLLERAGSLAGGKARCSALLLLIRDEYSANASQKSYKKALTFMQILQSDFPALRW